MFYTKTTIDTKIASLLNTIEYLTLELDALRLSIPKQIADGLEARNLQSQVNELKLADERQQSDIPFVEIISDGYDSELGVQLQLDWNAAFIKELQSKGYKGSSDRDVVNKWLIAVHKQLATQFEQADRI